MLRNLMTKNTLPVESMNVVHRHGKGEHTSKSVWKGMTSTMTWGPAFDVTGIKRLSHNLGKVLSDQSRNDKNKFMLLMFKEQY